IRGTAVPVRRAAAQTSPPGLALLRRQRRASSAPARAAARAHLCVAWLLPSRPPESGEAHCRGEPRLGLPALAQQPLESSNRIVDPPPRAVAAPPPVIVRQQRAVLEPHRRRAVLYRLRARASAAQHPKR